MHTLSNGLRSTYTKREVDSRLRVPNKKEVALQTTGPPTYLVIGIHVIEGAGGSGYTNGGKVTINHSSGDESIRAEVGTGGSLVELESDDTKVYTANFETVNRGTLENDLNGTDGMPDPH
jgi:hypothetical protein